MMQGLRYIAIVIAVFVLSMILPKAFELTFMPRHERALITYSVIMDDFLIQLTRGSARIYKTSAGKTVSEEEYLKALPLLYYRKLGSLGVLPDSIDGEKLTMDNLKKHNYFYSMHQGNALSPEPGLAPLIESTGEPKYFKISNQFISWQKRVVVHNTYTLKPDLTLSDSFNKALTEKGFLFPARALYGDFRAQKNYDSGCFITDHNNHLFTLKMVNGRPEATNIQIPKELIINHILCIDPANREITAIITSREHELYVLLGRTQQVVKLNITYNPATDNLLLFGNQFFKSISISNQRKTEVFVLNDNYETIRHFAYPFMVDQFKRYDQVESLIFPFKLKMNSASEITKVPSLVLSSNWWAIVINALLALLMAMALRKRIKKWDFFIILLTGIYGLLAIRFIK